MLWSPKVGVRSLDLEMMFSCRPSGEEVTADAIKSIITAVRLTVKSRYSILLFGSPDPSPGSTQARCLLTEIYVVCYKNKWFSEMLDLNKCFK